MSVEIHDRLIALLVGVNELRTKEAALRGERLRHSEQIAQSGGEVARCNGELDDVRENQLRLKREMDSLRDELFAREEEEAAIADEAHLVTAEVGDNGLGNAKRAWDARAKHLTQVR